MRFQLQNKKGHLRNQKEGGLSCQCFMMISILLNSPRKKQNDARLTALWSAGGDSRGVDQ